jgi:RNA polymerase sigma-70 factor (TIGR02960 family)
VAGYRDELYAHCYRMLGSVQDAEDALQESLLGAWRGLAGFEGRSSLRAWLYRVSTNACLRLIARRPRRMLSVDHGPPRRDPGDLGEWVAGPVWLEPWPDQVPAPEAGGADPAASYLRRESVELAFVAALQHLPGTQRAVLILREVLGFSAQEVSESLDTSVASVNSALQRARKAIAERLPDRSQQEVLRALGNRGVRTLVERYVDAWARGDVDALTRLLAADAVFSMPPWAMWWRGSDTIAAMAKDAVEICANGHAVPISANGQPAVAYWALNDETGRHEAMAIDVLTLEGDRVKEITAFINPGLFPRFGLPSELAPPASR